MCATFNGGSGDVFPGDSYGVTTASGGESMRFGFDFGRNKLTVNARAETAPVKFRAAFARGRCVLAVNGFYEWTADKRKYYYRAQGGGLLLCGLWRAERDDDRRRASVQLDIFGLLGEEKTPSAPRDCFAIITTAANDSVWDAHGRMPLIIDEKQADAWLYDERFARAHLSAAMPMLERVEAAAR